MATDAKKHTTIAAGEKPSRAAIAAAILSISDVIPVANATEATQVAVAIAQQGQNLATNPVVVIRADARGAHRIEYTYDTNGLVWLPASGVFTFATKAAADTFGTNSAALLTVGDVCRIGAAEYLWSGSAWVITETGWLPLTLVPASGWTAVGTDTIDYCVINRVLYFRGRLNATTGAGTVAVAAGGLPSGSRPAVNTTKLVGTTGGTAAQFVTVVGSDGAITVFKNNTTAVTNLPLESMNGIPVG